MQNSLCFLFVITFFTSTYVVANTETTYDFDHDYVETSTWQVNISLGYGFLSNPLIKKDNIPLIILPSIRYYGENIFFDNGTFGYTLNVESPLQTSFIIKPNTEKLFFLENDIVASVFIPIFNESQELENENKGISPPNDADNKLSELSELSDRSWAIDGGIQLNWFIYQNLSAEFSYLHDISNTYSGANGHARLNYSYRNTESSATTFYFSSGLTWKSDNLVNYYYAITETDTADQDDYYQTSSAISPFVSVKIEHRLTENLSIKGAYKYEWLDKNISNSPIVTSKKVITTFLGLSYGF